MEAYLVGTEVTVTIPLVDKAGNQLNVTAIDYRVVDQNNNEIVPKTTLAFQESADAVITVPASANNIAATSIREVRNIELFCTVDGNTVALNYAYALEPADPLKVGLNSFQSFSQAMLTAMDVPNVPAWEAASDREKIAALVDARNHIVQLNFSLLNSNINFGQDSLQYVPEGTYSSAYVARNSLFIFNGNLALLNPSQYAVLPERFKSALRLAQIAEADAILGGNPIDMKRQDGVVVETIGEVKQMYRSKKPLDLPVCKRALSYLSYFIAFGKRIGRGG